MGKGNQSRLCFPAYGHCKQMTSHCVFLGQSKRKPAINLLIVRVFFFFPPFFSISTNSYLSFLCLLQGLTGEEGAAAPWSSSVPPGSFLSQTWNDALTRETTQRSHCQEVGERVDLFHETKNERGREDNSATAGLS